jgi:succinoglycan biosynthesis transport protein ExoP
MHTSDDESGGLTLTAILSTLRRRQVFVAWTVGVCVLLAALVCIFMTRQYQAVGEIQVTKASSDGLGLDGLLDPSQSTSDALEANIALQTEAHVLESSTLALKVIEDLQLDKTKDFRGSFNPIGWAMARISPSGPPDRAGASLEDSPHRRVHALTVFAKNLKVKPVTGTRLIDVSYTSSNPKIAAAVVNELTRSLVNYNYQTRSNATTVASQWLGDQLSGLKKDSEALQEKVAQLEKGADVYSLGSADPGGKGATYSDTLDRLQQDTQALTEATTNRILKEDLYKVVQNGDPDLISSLSASTLAGASSGVSSSFSLLQTLRSQQAAAVSAYAVDESKYGSANPQLLDDRASLNTINAGIQAEIHRIGKRAENDYKAAQLVEDNLRGVYDKQRASADELNSKTVQLGIARQEADDSRTLYDNLFSRLKEAGVIEGLHSSNITIVDPGLVPSKPVKPNVPLYLAAAFVAGCILGVLGVLFLESVDDRIPTALILERTLNAPVLSVLPAFVSKGSKESIDSLPLILHRRLSSGAEQGDSRDVVPTQPAPAFGEAIRALRTSLLLVRGGIKPPRVIVVTSAAEGEGKSTVSINLAVALAQNGSRVLLVDAELRTTGLSERLHLKQNGGGLVGVLADGEAAVFNEPFSGLPNLQVLASGGSPSNPSELLGTKRMRTLIESALTNHDFVVIDTPPVVAVTDGLILSGLADVSLLIAREGVSTRENTQRAYRMLQELDDSQVGVVLNGSKSDAGSFSKPYGYTTSKYNHEV